MPRDTGVKGKKFEVDVYELRDILDSYGYTGLDCYVDSGVRRKWEANNAASPIDAIGHVVTALGRYRQLPPPRWAQARIADILETNENIIYRIVKEIAEQPKLL